MAGHDVALSATNCAAATAANNGGCRTAGIGASAAWHALSHGGDSHGSEACRDNGCKSGSKLHWEIPLRVINNDGFECQSRFGGTREGCDSVPRSEGMLCVCPSSAGGEQLRRWGSVFALLHQIRSGRDGYNRSGPKKSPNCCNEDNRCNPRRHPTARRFRIVNQLRLRKWGTGRPRAGKSEEHSVFPGGVPRERSFWLINFFHRTLSPSNDWIVEGAPSWGQQHQTSWSRPNHAPFEEIYERPV